MFVGSICIYPKGASPPISENCPLIYFSVRILKINTMFSKTHANFLILMVNYEYYPKH
ncbi:MAG: hypothetical protein Pg6B_07420 [Candidatus Azobacteroides pseudotrichonymphae]|nr:MAG: hypothetical protein Pg6B_07420 [Candidatus Azobacteroides pseudotrichonymphae]